MITPKDYIWPVIKDTIEAVWGFLSQLIGVVILAFFCVATIHYLQWFSPVVFGVIAFCYYVWRIISSRKKKSSVKPETIWHG